MKNTKGWIVKGDLPKRINQIFEDDGLKLVSASKGLDVFIADGTSLKVRRPRLFERILEKDSMSSIIHLTTSCDTCNSIITELHK